MAAPASVLDDVCSILWCTRCQVYCTKNGELPKCFQDIVTAPTTAMLPYRTVYIYTPLGRFSTLDISTAGIVSEPRRSGGWKHLARELPEDVSFGIGTPLVVEQSRALETAPGVWGNTPSYTGTHKRGILGEDWRRCGDVSCAFASYNTFSLGVPCCCCCCICISVSYTHLTLPTKA